MAPTHDMPPSALGVLLDIQRDVGEIKAEVRAQGARLAIVEPALWKLEEARQRDLGWSEGLARVFTVGRTAWVALGGAVVWLAQHMPFGSWWRGG